METEIVKIEPKAPEGSTDEFLTKIKEDSKQMIAQVLEDVDSRTIITKFDNLGQNQREILSQKISLLDERLNSDLEAATAGETPAAKNLSDLSVTLDLLNPEKIRQEKLWGFLPIKAKRVISRLKDRYNTNRSKIDNTINNLLQCREALIKDNVQLEQLALNVDEARKQVIAQAYLGELLIEHVEEEIPKATEEKAKKNLEKLRARLYSRVQDLRITENVDLQFEAAISTMMDNNVELKDAVERTVNVARPLLTVVMSLAVARQRQKAVQRSVEVTRSSLGNLLEAGAKETKEASEEIAALANQPVIALEKVESAYQSYLEAMEIAENAQKQGIADAQKAIVETRKMSRVLEERTESFQKDRLLKSNETEVAPALGA